MNKGLLMKIFELLTYHSSTEYILKLRSTIPDKRGLIKLLLLYRYHRIMEKNGSSIPLSAEISGNPSFPHGIKGVFISSGAIIGSGCTIFQQVTIGSNTLQDSKHYGAPRVGNNVYIGSGAKIVGGVVIGNNVRIGANCVVVDDVPDNSTVVLQKARVISDFSSERNNNYVKFENKD